MTGIFGKKIGMTNIFDGEGRFVPITVIEAGPCFVLETKTKETTGYDAVLLGYEEKKEKNTTKPLKGWFDKIKQTPKKFVREIRMDKAPSCKVGDKIAVSIFKGGDYVDISGTTIGKGFQGGMKRWGWSGGESGHGSMFHRAVGSIGASSYPSRVHKGKTMPGHMGAVKRTMQNLEVLEIDESKNLLIVKGSVPGHKGAILVVKHAKKLPPAEDSAKPEDKAKKDKKNDDKK